MMRIMRDRPDHAPQDVALLSDASGFWKLNPELPASEHAASNHSDGSVNLINHDLSLVRVTADRFFGLTD